MEEVLVWILDRLHNIGLSSDAESLAAGLLCGDKSLFATETIHDMRDAGMSHLLAVSGLHIGLLWALLWLALRPVLLIPYHLNLYEIPWNRALRLMSVSILWLYVWMIGFPPSAVRAATMLTVAQVSPLFGVDSWGWQNLVIAAMLMLCYDPSQMGEVGFQLSFAATAGILAFHPLYETGHDYTRHSLKKTFWDYIRPLRNLFLLTFSAQIFTLPLTAYYFHHLPLLGWVQGFLVVPVIAFLVYGLLFLLLFPATLGLMPLGTENLYHWLSLPVEVLSWWVIHVARWVSNLELFLVGGRVEFYPTAWETVLLEVILIGLSVSYLYSRRTLTTY